MKEKEAWVEGCIDGEAYEMAAEQAEKVALMLFTLDGTSRDYKITVPVPRSAWHKFWYRFLLGWKIE